MNGPVATLYLGWLRARLRSTVVWTLSVAAIVVATAAFYPALKNFFADFQSQGGAGVSSLLGLTDGIDPSSPLGYLWSNLYSNVVPWILMALGIALGAAAIAGDEQAGTLEYTLSSTATRSQMLITRFAGVFTILFGVAALSGRALLVTAHPALRSFLGRLLTSCGWRLARRYRLEAGEESSPNSGTLI
jgi:ABC-2 type transport system permease protein